MTGIATVFYPADATFNLAHYRDKHMPLVLSLWKGIGLSHYFIAEMDPECGYCMQVILFWDNIDHFREALESKSAETLMAGVPNFSSKGPVILFGKQVGSSK